MKNKTYKNLFNFFYIATKKYRLRIILFYIFIFICWGLIPTLIQPAIFASFLNKISQKTLTIKSSILLTLLYTLFFISTELLRFLFVEKQLWYGGILKAKNKIIKLTFNYIINHSPSYFSDKMSGVLMEKIKKIGNNFENIIDIGSELITYIIIPIISVVVYIKINIYISITLLFYIIVFLPTYYLYLNIISKKRKELTIEEVNANGLINDSISNIQTIKSFSKQIFEINLLKKQNIKILKKANNLFKTENFFNIIFSVINIFFVFIIFSIAFYFTFKKEMSIGTFVYINQNIAFLRISIYKIIEYSKIIVEYIADSVESYNTIFEKYTIKDKNNAKDIKINNGKIVFNNIFFKY